MNRIHTILSSQRTRRNRIACVRQQQQHIAKAQKESVRRAALMDSNYNIRRGRSPGPTAQRTRGRLRNSPPFEYKRHSKVENQLRSHRMTYIFVTSSGRARARILNKFIISECVH